MKKFLFFFVILLAVLIVPMAASAQTIYADVNGDGEVNISDVSTIIYIILGGNMTQSADVNTDGEVNISDINEVINTILGYDIPTPPGPGGYSGDIPEDILAELSASGMNIYYGDEPPIVDGAFIMEPVEHIAASGPWNTWITIEKDGIYSYILYNDHYPKISILFQNQIDNRISAMIMYHTNDGDSFVWESPDMYIMGNDNKFTISMYIPQSIVLSEEYLGMVISGELVGENINNMQLALIFDHLPVPIQDVIEYKRCIDIDCDGDRVSYNTGWENAWVKATDVNNKNSIITSPVIKKMAKSIIKKVENTY